MPVSSSTTTIPSILSIQINEKLTKTNYPLWRAQVLPALHAGQFEALLTGDDPAPEQYLVVTNVDKTTTKQINPAYTSWIARDQAVLGYLLSSLTRETLLHVSRCTTAAQAWRILANLYSTQTRARSVNTRITLATTKKHHLSVSDYYSKMCQYADDLTASGAPLRDDKLIAYILAGLDEDYNPVLSSVVARAEPLAPSELYAQLLSYEQHTSLQGNSSSGGSLSAMAASRGRGSNGGRGSGGSSRGNGRGRAQCGGYPNQSSGYPNNSSSSRPQCQVCRKVGHTAKVCWYRYEEDSTVEQRSAGFASSDGDNNWYTDSGATDHITGNLDKLTMHDPYVGNDQIHAANAILVIPLFLPPLVILSSTMSFMFHPLTKILFRFIVSPLTMTHLLNFILFSS
jgi:uncharacterized membrane protein YgcG